jgi:outer membrane lipoprotein-sorting protein
VVERADLGLPDIINVLGSVQGSSDLTSLINGKHTLRVWYSGPDKARVALVGTNGESDIIRNGKDVWIWDSKKNTATHHVLSPDEAAQNPADIAKNLPKSPQEAADLALKAIDPTTVVTTGNSATIAGRDAYELILSPRDTSSLVGQIRLAIDAKEHLPLRVQVFAKGESNAVFEVGFTQVTFARPDASRFQFTPPAGAKVEEPAPNTDTNTGPNRKNPDLSKVPDGTKKAPVTDTPQSTVIGKGWTSVFVSRTGTANPADEAKKDPRAEAFLNGLPRAAGGNRVLTSKLFTVMLTDDGRVLFGAVTPERLAEVAKDPAAQLK